MSMCSPARDMNAVYHAVRTEVSFFFFLLTFGQWGHSMAVDPMSVYCT